MIIRKMEERDLYDVAALYEILSGEKSNIESMVNQFALANSNKNYMLVVAEEQGKVAGTAMGIVCLNMMADFNSFLVIEAVIVGEEFRRKGIGKGILQYLEREAKSRGCSYLVLVSGEQREEAHRLYEYLGYGKDGVKGFRKLL